MTKYNIIDANTTLNNWRTSKLNNFARTLFGKQTIFITNRIRHFFFVWRKKLLVCRAISVDVLINYLLYTIVSFKSYCRCVSVSETNFTFFFLIETLIPIFDDEFSTWKYEYRIKMNKYNWWFETFYRNNIFNKRMACNRILVSLLYTRYDCFQI